MPNSPHLVAAFGKQLELLGRLQNGVDPCATGMGVPSAGIVEGGDVVADGAVAEDIAPVGG